ncbi:heterokaryon incompatibility protein-domain-containing protein [Annulohypoxylon nitens]|nr:heterokaryon incompatibility protein-domain-containing protein [Annulohypoxylon nitens]
MGQEFGYDKLTAQAIRLLKVNLTQDGSLLHGTISTHVSPESIKYICLSYTWGTPFLHEKNDPGDPSRWNKKSMLKLTDSSTGSSGTILITQNLVDFLHYLFLNPPDDVAYIWVDAICINQQDLAERASQVQMMGQIYKCCERMTIWLGCEDQNTEQVFQILASISEPAKCVDYPPGSKLYGKCWVTFLREAGFIWSGRSFIRSRQNALPNPFETHAWTKSPRYPVWLRGKLCSDPRDYVYASFGLLDHYTFPVDYEKPVEDVFREYCIDVGISELTLINKEHPTDSRLPNLVSWVPDLTSPLPGVDWETRSHRRYVAGGREILQYELVADNKVLRIEAFEVDAIRDLGVFSPDIQTGVGLAKSLALIDSTGWTTVGEHSLTEAFWRTLVANNLISYPNDEIVGSSFEEFCLFYLAQYVRDYSDAGGWADVVALLNSLHGKSQPGWLPSVDYVAEFLEATEDGNDPEAREMIGQVVEEMRIFVAALRNMFEDRIFFTTRNGRLGTGHVKLERGSRIFIVRGCGCPLVLREGSEGRYRLTGAVYLHGVMHGEEVKEGRFQDIELE